MWALQQPGLGGPAELLLFFPEFLLAQNETEPGDIRALSNHRKSVWGS